MTGVTLRPWAPGDLPLLVAANAPAMTSHLGGPESDDDVRERHARYLRLWDEGTARMFVALQDAVPAGGIGWWPIGEDRIETGWFVLPERQGRGIARAALALLVEDAVVHSTASELRAFPSVDNVASNAVCRGAGFTLRGEEDFPFRGVVLRTNVWALDLDVLRGADPAIVARP